ncbi:RipA family octameric membrane protein [Empedobacter brevis]|uniref:RipA family octameric membrane protein n=1 Tax=Empedobacter brevis TaxID=247 RepID=UPI00333EE942
MNLFKKTSNKNDLKYTLDKLYRCRDLEISNLWQRSVFLSVFLILCFSAYGYIGIELLKVDFNNDECSFKISILNLIATLILSVGIIFSIIWIMMSKASKAWYEVYENAITEFERKNFLKLGLPENNIMGMMKFPQNQRCDSIFSTNGGAFSPSRINILIGQVSLYLLIVLDLIHLVIIQIVKNNSVFGILSILILIITLITSIILLHSKKVESGFLRES